MNYVFNVMWLMRIGKIYLEEQLLVKYYMIKHLKLLKIRKRTSNKEVLLQWLAISLQKSLLLTKKQGLIIKKQQLLDELNKRIIKKKSEV